MMKELPQSPEEIGMDGLLWTAVAYLQRVWFETGALVAAAVADEEWERSVMAVSELEEGSRTWRSAEQVALSSWEEQGVARAAYRVVVTASPTVESMDLLLSSGVRWLHYGVWDSRYGHVTPLDRYYEAGMMVTATRDTDLSMVCLGLYSMMERGLGGRRVDQVAGWLEMKANAEEELFGD